LGLGIAQRKGAVLGMNMVASHCYQVGKNWPFGENIVPSVIAKRMSD